MTVRRSDPRGLKSNPTPHVLLLPPPPQLRRLLDQEAFAAAVSYRKRKDHFIFTIESSGVMPPHELLAQALDILQVGGRGR